MEDWVPSESADELLVLLSLFESFLVNFSSPTVNLVGEIGKVTR